MSTTVTELIHSSFRLIGAIAAGETLETGELDDALVTLNQMTSSWNTEGASLVGRMRQTISVSASNGPFAVPLRPVRIEAASVAQGGIDSPLEIVDSAGWEATLEKAAQSVFTKKLFCDYAYPNASVYIAPIPRLSAMLEIWSYIPIAAFALTTANIDLPPGYEMAVRYNLAIALLPEYPRLQPDPSLPAQAQAYKAAIVQANTMNHMHMPPQMAAVPPAGVAA